MRIRCGRGAEEPRARSEGVPPRLLSAHRAGPHRGRVTQHVDAATAQQHLPALLEQVAAGRVVVITIAGHPIARLAPVVEPHRPPRDWIVDLRDPDTRQRRGGHLAVELFASGPRAPAD